MTEISIYDGLTPGHSGKPVPKHLVPANTIVTAPHLTDAPRPPSSRRDMNIILDQRVKSTIADAGVPFFIVSSTNDDLEAIYKKAGKLGIDAHYLETGHALCIVAPTNTGLAEAMDALEVSPNVLHFTNVPSEGHAPPTNVLHLDHIDFLGPTEVISLTSNKENGFTDKDFTILSELLQDWSMLNSSQIDGFGISIQPVSPDSIVVTLQGGVEATNEDLERLMISLNESISACAVKGVSTQHEGSVAAMDVDTSEIYFSPISPINEQPDEAQIA